MRTEKKTTQAVLMERLTGKLDYPIGVNHFAVLLHGWMRKHPKDAPTIQTLSARKRKDGFVWLSPREVTSLSAYAGYDLTTD